MQLTIHKTFADDGEPLYFVAQSTGVTELSDTKLQKLLGTLNPADTTIRITNISSAFLLVQTLQAQGFAVVSCHWHATGIEKNLDAATIAQKFYALADDLMTPVKLRADIFNLRQMINARYSVLDFRRAAQLKLIAIARTLGLTDESAYPAYLEAAKRELDENKKALENPITKDINKAASEIPECVLLNNVLGITGNSWMTSASVVAYLGDMSRFATVSKLWKYSGWDVRDGKASRRAKGQVLACNPKLKTALWSFYSSMLKTRNPIWRPVFDKYKDAEILVHESKCTKCAGLKCTTEAQQLKKTQAIASHSGARAGRKVIKDILREYFVQVRGTDDHPACDTQNRAVGNPSEVFAAGAGD